MELVNFTFDPSDTPICIVTDTHVWDLHNVYSLGDVRFDIVSSKLIMDWQAAKTSEDGPFQAGPDGCRLTFEDIRSVIIAGKVRTATKEPTSCLSHIGRVIPDPRSQGGVSRRLILRADDRRPEWTLLFSFMDGTSIDIDAARAVLDVLHPQE